MIHVQLEGKRHNFCMLFDSYSSFKLAGIHEHDKMVGHSCILYSCMQCMDNKQLFRPDTKVYSLATGKLAIY